MRKLNEIGTAHDILRTKYKCHPYTYGYNGENLKHYDQVLTAKEDVGCFQTLDYLFEIHLDQGKHQTTREIILENISETHNSTNLNESLKTSFNDFSPDKTQRKPTKNALKSEEISVRKLYVNYESCEVENFLVQGKPYQQLSDHFGLSVNIEYCDFE
jgi:hypothetical protein